MPNPLKFQAVIYDMDGVLVDSEPLWDQAEREVLAEIGVDREQLLNQFNFVPTGMRINEVTEMFCYYIGDPVLNSNVLAEKIIDIAIKKIVENNPILPGVIESLELCRSLGLKIGLASSSAMRVIDTVTNLLNITEYFDVRVSAEHLTHGKPHPAVYLLAAEKLDVNPLYCITIEDSVAGMTATKAAKMTSIVIPPEDNRNNPRWGLAEIKLNSLLDLKAKHFM